MTSPYSFTFFFQRSQTKKFPESVSHSLSWLTSPFYLFDLTLLFIKSHTLLHLTLSSSSVTSSLSPFDITLKYHPFMVKFRFIYLIVLSKLHFSLFNIILKLAWSHTASLSFSSRNRLDLKLFILYHRFSCYFCPYMWKPPSVHSSHLAKGHFIPNGYIWTKMFLVTQSCLISSFAVLPNRWFPTYSGNIRKSVTHNLTIRVC